MPFKTFVWVGMYGYIREYPFIFFFRWTSFCLLLTPIPPPPQLPLHPKLKKKSDLDSLSICQKIQLPVQSPRLPFFFLHLCSPPPPPPPRKKAIRFFFSEFDSLSICQKIIIKFNQNYLPALRPKTIYFFQIWIFCPKKSLSPSLPQHSPNKIQIWILCQFIKKIHLQSPSPPPLHTHKKNCF